MTMPHRNGQGSRSIAMIEPVCAHGGMDYYDYGLLRALRRNGIRARLYTSVRGPLASADEDVVELFRGVYGRAPKIYRAFKWVLALRAAMSDAVRSGAELAHFHFFDTGWLERIGIWFAGRRGLKKVATVHDVESFHFTRKRASVAALLGSLDGIIVHNELSRNEVVSIMNGRSVPIAVIPHGNYLPYIHDTVTRQEARARLNLPADGPIVLFFGQIKRVKGLDIALHAMAPVRRAEPHVTLLIAGRPWKDDAAEYQGIIKDHELGAGVIWHNEYIHQTQVDWYFAAADAVLLPYRRIYQSGVLLMAMSYGVPVIASDLAGMREVIHDRENGYLFNEGDHQELARVLLEVIRQPSTARRIGERGKEHVQNRHDWGLIGRRTAEFYDEVLKTG